MIEIYPSLVEPGPKLLPSSAAEIRTMGPFLETVPASMAAVTAVKHDVCLDTGPPCEFPEFSLAEVAEHCDIQSCWIIISDKVYDVTTFIHEHPGGLDVIMEYAGSDATVAFSDKGHSKDANMLLSDCYLGNIIKEERIIK